MYSGLTEEHAGHIKRMHIKGWPNPYAISEGGYVKNTRDSRSPTTAIAIPL